ncbi:MAG: Trk system potassium transporter TrkA [Bacteroidota bacterium]
MRIIIAGAGEVGYQLAKMLADEDHDIILMDRDEEALAHAESHIDVGTMRGNVISIQMMEEAGIRNADLLVAATSQEEVNITTAIIGKHLGAKRTIARITNPEFQIEKEKLDLQQLGIDNMVFPEDLAADEICRLIKRSNLTDSFEFGDGRLNLTGVLLEEHAPLVGKNIIQATQIIKGFAFTVVAIQRKNETIIPRGDTVFHSGDHVYFISHPERIGDIRKLTGKTKFEIRNIMILGGGLIARLFAQKVSSRYQVKLVEQDRNKCYDLANELPDTLVIHGDGNNVELLEEEGLSGMDAFIALTGDSETNIISCLVAKSRGVKRTIALVENVDYISLSQNIGIDTLINKKLITVNNIFRYVREGHVAALTSLHAVDSEVLEFVVQKDSRITQNKIKDLKGFPRRAVIGGIIRNNKAHIASGDFHIKEDDHVVVFSMPSCIHDIESFFK